MLNKDGWIEHPVVEHTNCNDDSPEKCTNIWKVLDYREKKDKDVNLKVECGRIVYHVLDA